MADIEIEAEPVTSVSVKLVGEEYDVTPPKGSLAIVLADKMANIKDNPGQMMKSLNSWIVMAFGKKQFKRIEERLQDPEDALDIQHIMTLMQKLSEKTTGNPTT